MLGECAGGCIPLPQAKGPSTVGWFVILFGPESWQWGSGPLAGGGGSQEWAVALLGAHTPARNPRSISGAQAYIAYLFSSLVFEVSVLLCSENELRNVCRNAWQTVVL
jgi:hypothetical protein